jgi:hypothetical protein
MPLKDFESSPNAADTRQEDGEWAELVGRACDTLCESRLTAAYELSVSACLDGRPDSAVALWRVSRAIARQHGLRTSASLCGDKFVVRFKRQPAVALGGWNQ